MPDQQRTAPTASADPLIADPGAAAHFALQIGSAAAESVRSESAVTPTGTVRS
ncbi:MAG: hypothetical protein ABW137_02825 [Mycobacterium sp.]